MISITQKIISESLPSLKFTNLLFSRKLSGSLRSVNFRADSEVNFLLLLSNLSISIVILKRNTIFVFAIMLLVVLSCEESNSPSFQKNNFPLKQDGMILIPKGILHMGGDNSQADNNEFPKHKVAIEAFWMDETEVTNAQFETFINATSYITIAERPVIWEEIKASLPPNTPQPPDSLLQPGALVFQATNQPVSLNNPALWWRWTIGANWRHPQGPGSTIAGKENHPVVQVAWEDAAAYAKWMGRRLPTEAEWEWAARGGKENNIYPWGNQSVNEGEPIANFYQGLFPYQNTKVDGYETTAPVKSFPPNGYGLYEMPGNVWEWCSDWLDVEFYKKEDALKANTKGPTVGYNPSMPYQQEKVIRGGSFLCNDTYCSGYRNSRRMGSSPDTGLNHTGFRCVKDVKD